jgi:flagellar protein FliL
VAEEEKVDGGEEGEEQQAPSSKKKLIIIIALAVLVLAVAGGATYFLMSNDGSEEVSEEVSEEAEIVIAPAIYLDLEPPMLATLSVDGKQRYMQVSLNVMSRDQAALDAVEYHMPFIRSKLNSVYGGADFKMAQTIEGKEALREETLKVINVVLESEGEALIEAVYFTNFVMQ